jgi:hypothetical protein
VQQERLLREESRTAGRSSLGVAALTQESFYRVLAAIMSVWLVRAGKYGEREQTALEKSLERLSMGG